MLREQQMEDSNTVTQTGETGNPDALIGLTANIVSSFVGGGSNHIGAAELPGLIQNVHGALSGLGGQQVAQEKQEPKVAIKKSVQPDYIVCLEDGKKLKMLKRYLMTKFGMTPDQYRAKWGLASDYPMVAPNYAETRRKLAVEIGLGTKRARSTESRGAGSATRGGRAKAANGSTASNGNGSGRGRRATGAAGSTAAAAKGGRKSGGGRGRKANA
jgi:predicted transcriptional regulator